MKVIFCLFSALVIDLFAQQNYKVFLDNGESPSSFEQKFISYDNPLIKTDPVYLIDSIITKSNEQFGLKLFFEYNQDGKITEYTILSRSPIGWTNSMKVQMQYNPEGKLQKEISLGWNISWDSLVQISYTYNSLGKISSYLMESYENGWKKYSKSTCNYNSNGELQNVLTENWVNNVWANSYLINYYKNSSHLDSIIFQTWNSNKWENDKKTTFYSVDSILVRSWEQNVWVNYIKKKITLNGKTRIEEDQIWDGSNWLNSLKHFYTNNDNGYLVSAYCQVWVNNNWMAGVGDLLIDNPDGFKVGFITEEVSVYYKSGTNVENEITLNSFSLSQNFPNPFNPTTKIQYQISETGLVTLKVYDILGKSVGVLVDEYKPAGGYEVEFDGSNLSSGTYFYRLQTGEYVKTKKLILMK